MVSKIKTPSDCLHLSSCRIKRMLDKLGTIKVLQSASQMKVTLLTTKTREKINSGANVSARSEPRHDRSFAGHSRLLVMRKKVIDGRRWQAARDKLCVMDGTFHRRPTFV